MRFNILLLLLCLPILFSCSSNKLFISQQYFSAKDLYLDKEFNTRQHVQVETENDVFQLNDEMREMLNSQLKYQLSAQQKSYALLKHLFDEEQISLNYGGNANSTATETYKAKIANCLSLTIMAYSLASEADLKVSIREVKVPEYWVRNGQYNLLTGHVNLLIQEEDKYHETLWRDTATVIDFDPFVAKKKFPVRNIKKKTLLAMFYNNKGAEALANNSHEIAYQYLKAATVADTKFSLAWGNLGVLYRRTGFVEHAEKAYIKAINLKEDNLNALDNLALLYKQQGRHTEAEPIELYLESLRTNNPYYHALLADEALYKGDYTSAVKRYKRAISIDKHQHEFFFGLAKSYYAQNRLMLSKMAMKQAATLANVKITENKYLAKLSFLQEKSSSRNTM